MGIGKHGRLPWHLSADLQQFKRLTWGHHILMGRKTFESIGRPLPGRENIVLTRQNNWNAPGTIVFKTFDAGVGYALDKCEKELFIIGGGDIFAQSLDFANRIYLTRVHTDADCTIRFPAIEMNAWTEIEIGFHPADERNEYLFVFRMLEKSLQNRP